MFEERWDRRLFEGDPQATRAFVERVEPIIRRVVGAYAPTASHADDWTQEVFVRLLERIDRFAGHAPIEHWVAKVSLRVCLDQLRVLRKDRRTLAGIVDLIREYVHPNDAQRQQRAAKEIVDDLLRRLPPDDRMVIQLLDLEERSVAEVSQWMGRSEAWVKVRAHRARKWLEATCKGFEKR